MNWDDIRQILYQNNPEVQNIVQGLMGEKTPQESFNATENLKLLGDIPQQQNNFDAVEGFGKAYPEFTNVAKKFLENKFGQPAQIQQVETTQTQTPQPVQTATPSQANDLQRAIQNLKLISGLIPQPQQAQDRKINQAEVPTLTAPQNQYMQSVIGAKAAYGAALGDFEKMQDEMRGINYLEQNPEEMAEFLKSKKWTAEDFSAYKSDLQNSMAENEKLRTDINSQANTFRQLFTKSGGTEDQLGLYGSNKTLDEAMQALAVNNVCARNDLLYGDKYQMSADEYFRDRYEDYWRQGATHEEAERLAGRDARNYQVERRNALNQGLDMYGRTDGRLNDDGMAMVKLLSMDSPELANVDLNSYALPRNEYQNNFTEALARFKSAADLEKLLQQQAGQMSLQEYIQAANNLRKQWDIEQRQAEEQGRNNRFIVEEQGKNDRSNAQNKTAREVAAIRSAGKGGRSSGGGSGQGKEDKEALTALEKTDTALKKQIDMYEDQMKQYEEGSAEYQALLQKCDELIEQRNEVLAEYRDRLNKKNQVDFGDFKLNDTENNKNVIRKIKELGGSFIQGLALWKAAGGDAKVFRDMWDRVK